MLKTKTVVIQYLALNFIASYRVLNDLKSKKDTFSLFFIFFRAMASKSTTSDSSSTDVKLVLNSPLDSEETFEVKMAKLKTTLIKESIYHCVSESNSNDRLISKSTWILFSRNGKL